MSGFTIDPQRGPHIRDYSDQSQDRVVIYSNSGWWATDGCGYTNIHVAGIYTRDRAYQMAGHCGPEKECCFHNVPADHVPTLQAEVELLREALEEIYNASVEVLLRHWGGESSVVTKAKAALDATKPKD